jgi:adenylate kinase
MIIALTGTPGTGKTSIARELDGFNTLDLTKFVKQNGLGEQEDEFEVDIETMVKALEDEIDPEEDTVIDGHLSHHFPADFCVVLRCNPEELRERLSERGYPEEKVEENVESEILDVLLGETVSSQDNIIEVDTTDKEAEDVAKEIKNRIKEKDTGYGEIDWTEYL